MQFFSFFYIYIPVLYSSEDDQISLLELKHHAIYCEGWACEREGGAVFQQKTCKIMKNFHNSLCKPTNVA